MNRFIYLVCVACTFCVTYAAVGQSQQPIEFSFDATSVINDQSEEADQRMALNLLIRSLEEQGGVKNEKDAWLFIVGVSGEDESGKVGLSLTILQKLPEPIVQLGKNSEAFYMRAVSNRPASLDPEGKEIREYMSEEYMRQFASPWGLYVEVVPKADLQKEIDAIVERFVAENLRR